jgi:ABC-type nickel/cobalt efflux system permease component RcnA
VLIDFALAPAGRAAAGTEAAAARGAPLDEAAGLKRALLADELGPWGWLLALGLAFGLGALHALSPGHGKTLVAAYLVGSRGTVRHAVLLGGIVTATHVSSVVVLGLVALWASSAVVPERLTPWIALAAGLLVLAMGGWMLARRLRARGRTAHHHHHPDRPAAARVRWSELLLLGLSGGMVPCPSAAVVLLSAIYLGRIGLGLLLIAAFSLGLAASLVIIGVLVVRGRHLLERLAGGPRSRRLAAALPLLSALLITTLGGAMTALAVADLFL